MIKISKILFPTDFSEYSNHALLYANELAKSFGAKVIALHVVGVPTYAGSYEIAIDLTTLRETIEEAARKRMDDLVAKIREAGVEVEGEVRAGVPFVEIIEASNRHDADVIVLATHGWGAIKHLLLGSTAEKVVRKASRPVLTVRSPEHEFVVPE